MTEPTAVPVNLFENDRELMVVAPMPGVAPEDITIDVTDDGHLTLRAAMHGEGQERIAYLSREWSYGPHERTIALPYAVDALRANVTYGNGVVSITFPKADRLRAGNMLVERTGHSRGVAAGHRGTRGGASEPDSSTLA